MKRRVTTALLGACVISGGCTYLLGRRISTATATVARRRIQYVAPARAIAAGELLEAKDLTWAEWPAQSPLSGALTQTATAVGRAALYPLESGQPILARDLADAGAGSGLAIRIPKGMRAVALRSDDVVGVAGFIAPDSRVDVLVTYRAGPANGSETATVVQNAQVLAAGQRLDPDPKGRPQSETVVTLLLDPIDSERAVLASTQGNIHFILRNTLDTGSSPYRAISLAELGAADGSTANAVPPPSSPSLAAGARRRPLERVSVETVFGSDEKGDDQEEGSKP